MRHLASVFAATLLPAGVGLDTLESIRDQATVVRLPRQSAEYAWSR